MRRAIVRELHREMEVKIECILDPECYYFLESDSLNSGRNLLDFGMRMFSPFSATRYSRFIGKV